MSRVEQIRQSVDGTLDRWQVRAEAMEAQLEASQEQVMERVEAGKKAYLDTIDKVKSGIAESKSLAEAEKQRLQTRLDEARVQFALGKAETVEAFNEQCTALRRELANIEKEVDTELAAFDEAVDETLDQVAKDLVEAGDALDAEMDVAGAQLEAITGKAKVDFEAKVGEVRGDLAAFKAKIEAERADASANVQAFESEFDEGWNKIKSAFKNLK